MSMGDLGYAHPVRARSMRCGERGSALIELVAVVAGVLVALCLALEGGCLAWAQSRADAYALTVLHEVTDGEGEIEPASQMWGEPSNAAFGSTYVAKGVSEVLWRELEWKVPQGEGGYFEVPVSVGYQVVHVGVAIEYAPLTPLGQAIAKGGPVRVSSWLEGIRDVGLR